MTAGALKFVAPTDRRPHPRMRRRRWYHPSRWFPGLCFWGFLILLCGLAEAVTAS